MVTFTASHDVGDRVWVADLETYAVIRSISFGPCGSIQFELAYFHNGDRKTAHVFADEIRIER